MALSNPSSFQNVVTIPIKSSGGGGDNEQEQEFIDICGSELPRSEDVIKVLKNESATAELWHRVALLYYSNGDPKSFLLIADEGYREKQASHESGSKEASVVPLLLSIGGYFYTMASIDQGDASRTEKLIARMSHYYNRIETLGIEGFEVEYYVARAYAYLLTGDPTSAEKHFTFILSSLNSTYIPAIVGKAMLSYSKKDYTGALQLFRQALQLNPNSPANVRLGIGHCFWKLKQREKAKLAYERAVEVYPKDFNALCALATYYLSTMTQDAVVIGVKLLARAHSICPTHPATQLYLADHYYYKKEFDKSLKIAIEVCKNSSVDDIRKRSAYLAGRCYQAKEDYKYAMHYYYQALSDEDNGFNLPYFGLAQCYLNFNDIQHCADTMQKILLREPNNRFAMKILGSLECNSDDPVARIRSRTHLKAALEKEPDDLWTVLSFATSMECFDDNLSSTNYSRALTIMKLRNMDVDPTIYNNFGCTLFRLGRYSDAYEYFQMALDLVKSKKDEATGEDPMMITLNFNRARAKEALHEYGVAETIYKDILKSHPSYFSCFIRLAVIYRDRNNLHEAEAYFKEALRCNHENPDVWVFIGNLHLAQGETIPAQKKFLRILNQKTNEKDGIQRDSYSMIALGNIEMSKMFKYLYDTNTPLETQLPKIRDYMKSALAYFQEILEREPNNIWAANGVGCILAAKGLFNDAREVFSQVRETTHNFKDVWINIGNTYLEQELYFNAIQMYEGCKKFSMHTDIKLLQALAKAYYSHKSFKQAKMTLLKCRRVAPYDTAVLFALGKTLRKIAWQPFQDPTGFPDLPAATKEGLQLLKQAKKIFKCLSIKQSNPTLLRSASEIEAHYCDDLMKQAPHMISRIQDDFRKEQNKKYKHAQTYKAFKDKQRKEQELLELRKRKEEEEAMKKRAAVQVKSERVKQTLELEASNETKKKERKMKKEKDRAELIDHSFIDDGNDEGIGAMNLTPPLATRKSKPKKKKITKIDTKETASSIQTLTPSPSRKQKREDSSVRTKKSYSRIKVAVVSDDSDDPEPVSSPIPPPRKIRALSPDITDLAGLIKRSTEDQEPKKENRAKDNVTKLEEESGQHFDKQEYENQLYMDICASEAIAETSNGEDINLQDASGLYDDLPPVLTKINYDNDEMAVWEPEGSGSPPPPVLHSFYSDYEEDDDI